MFLYLSDVCRSDVIWEEQKKKGRWKALKVRICDELEAAWTTIQQDLSVGRTPNYIYKSGDMEVSMGVFCVLIVRRNSHYYPTLLRGVQITRETSTNITRYLYLNLGKSEFWGNENVG